VPAGSSRRGIHLSRFRVAPNAGKGTFAGVGKLSQSRFAALCANYDAFRDQLAKCVALAVGSTATDTFERDLHASKGSRVEAICDHFGTRPMMVPAASQPLPGLIGSPLPQPNPLALADIPIFRNSHRHHMADSRSPELSTRPKDLFSKAILGAAR
jgi:hypothetical protein